MTEHQAQAAEVTALLELDRPPVALAFLAQPPEAVPVVTQASPSSCAFWIRAESSVFYATAVQHQHCQIGAMVMGFDLPPAVKQEIGGLVETMAGCNYLSPEEGDKIPSVTPASAGILYGPLADLPTQPDAVLLWLTPAQAMICQEAIGSASWAEAPERISGRPACAAIPLAMQGERPRLSFGCKGMRTFTGVADDRLLAVLPGGKLADFLARLRVTVAANAEMEAYYRARKAEVAAAAT